jgi:hypothetical protein
MTKASLAEVRVPVRIIVGSKDDQALPDVNARPIASAIPNAELEIIPNVAHYTFLARCNLLGKVVARSLCTDPDDTDRGRAQTGQRGRPQILRPYRAKSRVGVRRGRLARMRSPHAPEVTHRSRLRVLGGHAGRHRGDVV